MGQEKSPTVSERDGKLEPRLHTLEVMVREAPIGIAYWFQGGSLSNQRHMPLSGGRNLIFLLGAAEAAASESASAASLCHWRCGPVLPASVSGLGPRRCRWLMPRPRPGAGRESESLRFQVSKLPGQHLRHSVSVKHNALSFHLARASAPGWASVPGHCQQGMQPAISQSTLAPRALLSGASSDVANREAP